MRLFVIIVLMALLPLRGWAGDGMAIRMASSVASHHGAAPPQTPVVAPTLAVDHADCLGHGNMEVTQDTVAGNKAQTVPASSDHCSSCPTCQACFTVGLLVPSNELPAQFHRTAFLQDRAALVFVSADLAQSQKPPIS